MKRRGIARWWLILLVGLGAIACAAGDDDDNDAGDDDTGADDDAGDDDAAAEVDSWLYLLQNLAPAEVAATGFALVVTDYSADGTAAGEWSASEIAVMQESGKLVVSYFSIGEAEDYRFYWRDEWADNPPPWLGPENPDWAGNYKVRYWLSGWQDILYAYLDRILAEGFDGMYLDIIDAYYYWSEENPENADAAQDMMDLVAALADYARAEHPGFLVFPQNAVELVENDTYLATIDGVGKEDTWYWDNDPADPDDLAYELPFLDRVADAGKLVLCVDYCRQPALVEDFYEKAWARGYLPYSTVRDLDQLIVNEGLDP